MSQETQTIAQKTPPAETPPAAVHTGHPTPATYVKVAITLAAITAAEVAIFYANWLGHGIIPVLAVLSVASLRSWPCFTCT